MAIRRAKLLVLGNENDTKKSHIIAKIMVSNSCKYDNKSTLTQQISINNDLNQSLILEIPPMDITEKYNVRKSGKSNNDKEIKTRYNSADIIFIIYNVCNLKSFEKARKYYNQYKENKNNMINSNIIVVLIGHKLGSYTSFKRDVKIEDGQQFALKNDILFCEVSVIDNSIDLLFQDTAKCFIDKIMENIKIHRNIIKPIMSTNTHHINNVSISSSITNIPQMKKALFDNYENHRAIIPQNDDNNYKAEALLNHNDSEYNEAEEHEELNYDELLSKLDELNWKIKDYENIVYSLELENASKQRAIERQNDEINKLIIDLRSTNNKIEELKNNNLWQHSKRATMNDIGSRKSSKTDDMNMFSKLTNSLKVFSATKIKENNGNKELKDNADELAVKCAKLETMTVILKQISNERDKLKKDLIEQIGIKQKEINDLKECLEGNQIGFNRYKQEIEEKIIKWREEKKVLINQKRKCDAKIRRLEKSKEKYKNY